MPIDRWPSKDLLSANISMNIKIENKQSTRRNTMTKIAYPTKRKLSIKSNLKSQTYKEIKSILLVLSE